MIIISHDRLFLDRVVTKIFELHAGRLRTFVGNYAAYVRQRQERHDRELGAWQAQQDYIAKQEDYIRRVHYGQLHKQAQSRRKALERLERVDRPVAIEAPRMHFGQVQRSGDIVLQVERLTKSYKDTLFADLSFTLERGRRLGMMGPNGCGKTTLLRILMGQEPADRGRVQIGSLVRFGYYDQHLQTLPPDQPVIRAIWPQDGPETTEQQLRDLLGRFGLSGDQVYQKVANLSGGERSRAALAALVAKGVNVLVLDEPTNHLDIWACEALETALLEFAGTIIVVSHDRYFLNRLADWLIVFEGPGQTRLISGNYETYERMRLIQTADASATVDSATPIKPTLDSTFSTSPGSKRRKRRFPYRKAEDIEADIAAAEARRSELELLLGSPALYRDPDRVKETRRAFDQCRQDLERLYEHWEEALELN
jgi:ATP-binding cassette subfamily F protein 3